MREGPGHPPEPHKLRNAGSNPACAKRASDGARHAARGTPTARTVATLVALCLVSSSAQAQSDGGVVLDAPRVLKQPDGTYLFNRAAFLRVDEELKRLQQVERVHQGEPSWATPVVVGLLTGVVMGAAGALAGVFLWERLAGVASNPSP